MQTARQKVQKVLSATDTNKFSADDWAEVLDCLGGCPPEVAAALRDLQKSRSLDNAAFLDEIFGPEKSTGCALRIIQITDVYILDNFPSLRTLIQKKEAELKARFGGESRCISMLTGDFLAPYLLSSIDRGTGMIRMLNETPINYVTWGNHEADLSHEDVMCRVEEYEGVWINSNMQSHESFKKCKCQKDVEIIELRKGDKVHRVGLVGVLSGEPSLYKPGAFGGATIEDPWKTLAHYKKSLQKEKCDLVIPLCHLYENQDEITCKNFDFPVVLSGHDHHIVDRIVDGTRILKPGSDGHYAVMLDIIWDGSDGPKIEAELLKVADFEADALLAEHVKEVYSTLDHLRYTQVVKVPKAYRPLSSVNSRGSCTSAARFFCTEIRNALNLDCLEDSPHCDCVVINGGNFRGERDYKDVRRLSLEDLKSEIDESVEIVVAELPGWILQGLRETWKVVSGAWMQHDDGIEVDYRGHVVSVAGKALDEDGTYRIGTTRRFGIQLMSSVVSYWEQRPELRPHPESAVPVHSLLLHYWAEKVWVRIWAFLDKDGNGRIDPEEIQALDRTGDGELDQDDIMCAVKSVANLETFEGEYTLTDLVMKASNCFGPSGKIPKLHTACFQVAGHRGQGTLTLREINHRRRHRRKQLKEARTRESQFPAELLPDGHVQDQQNV
ncbi:unnamed protein product [Effrenium voratum]|nr:unnamed protein product [Effrenium voratum]